MVVGGASGTVSGNMLQCVAIRQKIVRKSTCCSISKIMAKRIKLYIYSSGVAYQQIVYSSANNCRVLSEILALFFSSTCARTPTDDITRGSNMNYYQTLVSQNQCLLLAYIHMQVYIPLVNGQFRQRRGHRYINKCRCSKSDVKIIIMFHPIDFLIMLTVCSSF